MKVKERLERIAEIAETLRWLTGNPARALRWTKQVNTFCEGVHFLAAMPDVFIESNIEQFETLRKSAADVLKAVRDGEKADNAS